MGGCAAGTDAISGNNGRNQGRGQGPDAAWDTGMAGVGGEQLLFQPLVGEGQRLVSVVDDQHPVQIGSGLLKPGLHRVAQPVLGGLIDHIEGLWALPYRAAAFGWCRPPPAAWQSRSCPRETTIVHSGLLHLAHPDHGDRRFRFRFLQCDRLHNGIPDLEFRLCTAKTSFQSFRAR